MRMIVTVRSVGALAPGLRHDVVDGCFELKPGTVELMQEGALGLDELVRLPTPRPHYERADHPRPPLAAGGQRAAIMAEQDVREMRTADNPRGALEIAALAALSDPSGAYYSIECDGQGCRKVQEI